MEQILGDNEQEMISILWAWDRGPHTELRNELEIQNTYSVSVEGGQYEAATLRHVVVSKSVPSTDQKRATLKFVTLVVCLHFSTPL